jgi:hypothetical protein
MARPRAYEEVIDFIARGGSPGTVVAFRPSEEARARVADLVIREKVSGLAAEEKSELDHYIELEHIMRLARRALRSICCLNRTLLAERTTNGPLST